MHYYTRACGRVYDDTTYAPRLSPVTGKSKGIIDTNVIVTGKHIDTERITALQKVFNAPKFDGENSTATPAQDRYTTTLMRTSLTFGIKRNSEKVSFNNPHQTMCKEANKAS
jgi:hypothetical protein